MELEEQILFRMQISGDVVKWNINQKMDQGVYDGLDTSKVWKMRGLQKRVYESHVKGASRKGGTRKKKVGQME